MGIYDPLEIRTTRGVVATIGFVDDIVGRGGEVIEFAITRAEGVALAKHYLSAIDEILLFRADTETIGSTDMRMLPYAMERLAMVADAGAVTPSELAALTDATIRDLDDTGEPMIVQAREAAGLPTLEDVKLQYEQSWRAITMNPP